MFKDFKKMSSISQSIDIRVGCCSVIGALTQRLKAENATISSDVYAIVKVRLWYAS